MRVGKHPSTPTSDDQLLEPHLRVYALRCLVGLRGQEALTSAKSPNRPPTDATAMAKYAKHTSATGRHPRRRERSSVTRRPYVAWNPGFLEGHPGSATPDFLSLR